MDAKEKFSKAQGSQAKAFNRGRLVLHIVSVPFTAWGFYQNYFGGTLAESNLWFAALSIAVALAIRYLIGTQELSVARQLVWQAFPNLLSRVTFIVSFTLMAGFIFYDHQTSQVGRIAGIDEISGNAETISTYSVDSTRQHHERRYAGIFKADSASAMAALSIDIQSHKAALNAARTQVQAMQAKAKRVKATSPSWAAGIRENARKLEASANIDYNRSVAESKKQAAATVRSYRTVLRNEVALRDSIATADLISIRHENKQIKSAHQQNTQIAQSAGKWLVVISSIGSFILCLLKEAYRRISGMEMEGEAHNPSDARKNPLRHFYGFFTDHLEVIDQRMQATRDNYRKASVGKGGYQLPPSSKILPAISGLAFIYGVGQTFVFNADQYSATKQAGLSLPFPYNWGVTLLALTVFIISIWRNKWNPKMRSVSDSPPPITQSRDNLSESVSTDKKKSPETVVRQDFQPVPDIEDNSVEIATPDEIRRAKDRCRKAYIRQFVSATRAGQDNNADKFRRERKRLRGWGYKVTASGPVEKRNVKIEGKPEVVTFKRLIISE